MITRRRFAASLPAARMALAAAPLMLACADGDALDVMT